MLGGLVGSLVCTAFRHDLLKPSGLCEVTKHPKVEESEKWGVKCSEVKWRFFGEICVLSLIYSYVAICRFCVVCCHIIICFSLLFSNNSTYVFNIFLCLFSMLYILCFCIVLCTVSPFVYRCLFPIFVQDYWPLPPDGNPIAVNKYHITS